MKRDGIGLGLALGGLALVGCRDADAKKLEELAERGVALRAEQCLVFTLWFQSKEEATRSLASAQRDGWRFTCDAAKDGTYYCSSPHKMVPDVSKLRGYRDEFERLADAADGAYDGWEIGEASECEGSG